MSGTSHIIKLMKDEIVIDEDSVNVDVEMPLSERKKVTTAISTWQFSTSSQETGNFKLFLCANETYVRNVINKKQQLPQKQRSKSKMPSGMIIREDFTTYLKKPDGIEDKLEEIEGEIMVSYIPYKGIKVMVTFKEFEPYYQDYFVARFRVNEKDHKTVKSHKFEKEFDKKWSLFVDDKELDIYLNKFLALEVQFDRDLEQYEGFVGIRNDGNTCYMNSILQILFFIRPLRKMVIDYQGQGKVMLALKDIFCQLIDGPDSRSGSVDAEQLIEAYGRFAEQPRRQQDTQQFLLGFLEELEGQCGSLAQLWQGQQNQIIESIEDDKPYSSKVKEQFSGLDLPLQSRGNTFGELYDSLKHLLDSEKVDDKIETDDFGKVAVRKSRQFLSLPPVLFLTLKRYQFKKFQTRPTKIMANLHYPVKINLGFLYGTPTGADMEYELFAVTVHRGQHYSSGHYYSYVNTSQDADEPCWIKFDDSRVRIASQEQALNFTGGKGKTYGWNTQFERYMQNQFTAQDTAYILVYYKKQVFRQYQQLEINIPREWFKQRKERKEIQVINADKPRYQVEVAILDLNSDTITFWSNQTIPIALEPDKDVVTQLKNFNSSLLGCKVGSVWKVFKQPKKAKKLIEFADLAQTPSRIFELKRGHRKVDFLLVVPDKAQIFRSSHAIQQNNENNQGIVATSHFAVEGIVTEIVLLDKRDFDEFIAEKEKKIGKKADIDADTRDSFMYGWNDYMQIIFQ